MVVLLPIFSVLAQNNVSQSFKAKIIKILGEKEIVKEDGSKTIQQNLELIGLEGKWANKKIEVIGISEIEVISAGRYKVGDKVWVQITYDENGNKFYNIQNFDRQGYLYWLAAIFCIIIFIIGRQKGLRALLSLIISFFIILKVILDPILNGGNPLWWGLWGSLLILMVIIYLTEGWNRKSHLAILSVFFSLLVILILSWIFNWFN